MKGYHIIDNGTPTQKIYTDLKQVFELIPKGMTFIGKELPEMEGKEVTLETLTESLEKYSDAIFEGTIDDTKYSEWWVDVVEIIE